MDRTISKHEPVDAHLVHQKPHLGKTNRTGKMKRLGLTPRGGLFFMICAVNLTLGDRLPAASEYWSLTKRKCLEVGCT